VPTPAEQIREDYREAVASAIEGNDNMEAWDKVRRSLARSIVASFYYNAIKASEDVPELDHTPDLDKLLFAKSGCGAGSEGNSGFQPGNTCAGEGGAGEEPTYDRSNELITRSERFLQTTKEWSMEIDGRTYDVGPHTEDRYGGRAGHSYEEYSVQNYNEEIEELQNDISGWDSTIDDRELEYITNNDYSQEEANGIIAMGEVVRKSNTLAGDLHAHTGYWGKLNNPKRMVDPGDPYFKGVYEHLKKYMDSLNDYQQYQLQQIKTSDKANYPVTDEETRLLSNLYVRGIALQEAHYLLTVRKQIKIKGTEGSWLHPKEDFRDEQGIRHGNKSVKFDSLLDFVDSRKLVYANDADYLYLVHQQDGGNPDAIMWGEGYGLAKEMLEKAGVEVPNTSVGFGLVERRGKANTRTVAFASNPGNKRRGKATRPTDISINHRLHKGRMGKNATELFEPGETFDELGKQKSPENPEGGKVKVRPSTVNDYRSATQYAAAICLHEMAHVIHASIYMNHKLGELDLDSAYSGMNEIKTPRDAIAHAEKHGNFPNKIFRSYWEDLSDMAEELRLHNIDKNGMYDPADDPTKYDRRTWAKKVAEDVSKYASEGGDAEFIPETFVGLMLGREYDSDIMAHYNAVGGIPIPGITDK